jgi:hypothetical protein
MPIDRTRELLARDGLDRKDGTKSQALTRAIRMDNENFGKLLIDNGAPVNPVELRGFDLPVGEAAWEGKTAILKLLLSAGAKVDSLDHQGTTYLARGYLMLKSPEFYLKQVQILTLRTKKARLP